MFTSRKFTAFRNECKVSGIGGERNKKTTTNHRPCVSQADTPAYEASARGKGCIAQWLQDRARFIATQLITGGRRNLRYFDCFHQACVQGT